MIHQINEKKQKRAAFIADMRAVNDRITSEKRSLTAEEATQISTIETDIAALDGEIRSLETTLGLQKRFANENSDPVPGAEGGQQKRNDPFASKEYRDAFASMALGRDFDARALNIGAAADGGSLVPTDFLKQLINDLRTHSVMRQLCRVIPLTNTANIPNVTGHATATWDGEAIEATETKPQFGNKSLGAYKMNALVKASDELLSDSAIDVVSFLAGEFAEAFGLLEDSTLLAESRVNATKSPDSIVANLTGGQAKTTAAIGTLTFDDLIDLEHAVKSVYRNNATFLMGDDTAKILRKLKDNDGQYLWQNSTQAGQPDMIHGKAISFTDALGFTNGKAAVLFGDFQRIWIADRGNIAMKRLNELYATSGQVGFLGFRRLDAVLTIANAMAKLTVKAS